jgi:hypothetical protein
MQSHPVIAPVDTPGSISGFQHLGYVVLVVYLFLIHSRIFDVKFGFLHLPGISYRIILVTMLLSRAFLVGLKHPIGRSFYFFSAWFVLSIPFSMWKGGSTGVLMEQWLPAFVMFLSVSGLLGTFGQIRRAILTVGYGLCVLTFIAVIWGSTEETGRLFLPNGKFSNPNEMAQALTLGLPLAYLIFQESQALGKRVAAAGVMFVMLLMISKCGSRGALITMIVLALIAFLRASIMGKTKLLIGGALLIAILVGLMPGKLLRRYRTMGQDDDEMSMSGDYDAQLQGSAVESTMHRRELLKRSIKYTFQHPLFGVGPGMFPVAEDADMRAQGYRKGTWQGTHNSYTEVSSEEGIPALIAYVCIIFISYRKTWQLHKRTRDDTRLKSIANCAQALNYCIIVYAVSVFFDYIAYTQMLSVFAGLALALDLHASAEIEQLTAAPAQPAPIPFAQFRPNWRRTAGMPQEA